MNYLYEGQFAGLELQFAFRHPETAFYFGHYLHPAESVQEPIYVSKKDCRIWMEDYGLPDDGSTEFAVSAFKTGDRLIPTGRMIIHGAAFVWKGKVFLFCADSGTGKSTQLKNWGMLYGKEMSILNGDKPILKLEKDHSFIVHPSPWKGKEEWGDDSLSAPLGGIILLQQSARNEIHRAIPYEAAAILLSYCFSMFEEEHTTRKLSKMIDHLIRTIPIWKLQNTGNIESAQITHDAIDMEE